MIIIRMHDVKENLKVFNIVLFLNLKEDVFDNEKIHCEITQRVQNLDAVFREIYINDNKESNYVNNHESNNNDIK